MIETVNEKQDLLYSINKKRQEMIAIARQKGYVNIETLKCSQELDKLIVLYQRAFK